MKLIQRLRFFSSSAAPNAVPTKLRKKRFLLFRELIGAIDRQEENGIVKVADFGGTSAYWDQVYDMNKNDLKLQVTLINKTFPDERDDRFRYIRADVRDLRDIPAGAFDVGFSNSLIEHLGDLSIQAQVLNEMRRVSDFLYLQTPNVRFLWEPHYAMPFVHWLSLPTRMKVLSLATGTSLKQQYDAYIRNPVRLLSRSELQYLFPANEFEIRGEHVLGMVKSWVVRSPVTPSTRAKCVDDDT